LWYSRRHAIKHGLRIRPYIMLYVMTLRGIYQQDGVVYTCIYTMHTCISSSYRYRYTRAHTQLYRLLNEYKKIVAGGGLALWAGGSAGEDAMTIKPAINQNGLAIWRHCAGPRLRATAYIPSWPNGDLFFFFFCPRLNSFKLGIYMDFKSKQNEQSSISW